MIPVAEAKASIERQVMPLPPKRLPLDEAAGCVLAESVTAAFDIPAFAQSSMDGYALAYGDLGKPLPILGEMAAGAKAAALLPPGHAMRIFTGAPLPDGADTVIMQEKTLVRDGFLIVRDDALIEGSHVRPKGAEIGAGTIALQAGSRLTPGAIGFLAGIGIDRLSVYPPPSVSIVITGDELQKPGRALAFGQVYEANSFALLSALKEAGIDRVQVHYAKDDLPHLQSTLHTVLAESDCVLLTGGVSVGDYDFVLPAAAANGIIQQFHKVRQRPGKPFYFGLSGRKPVFGLPGNPSSVLTCFYEYVLPALGILSRRPLALKIEHARLGGNYSKPAGLTVFLKGHHRNGEAMPLDAQESFRLRSFAEANCLISLPEGMAEYTAGDRVEVHMLPGCA